MGNEMNGALTSYLTRRPVPPSSFHFVIPALAPMSSLDDVTKETLVFERLTWKCLDRIKKPLHYAWCKEAVARCRSDVFDQCGSSPLFTSTERNCSRMAAIQNTGTCQISFSPAKLLLPNYSFNPSSRDDDESRLFLVFRPIVVISSLPPTELRIQLIQHTWYVARMAPLDMHYPTCCSLRLGRDRVQNDQVKSIQSQK